MKKIQNSVNIVENLFLLMKETEKIFVIIHVQLVIIIKEYVEMEILFQNIHIV